MAHTVHITITADSVVSDALDALSDAIQKLSVTIEEARQVAEADLAVSNRVARTALADMVSGQLGRL